MGRAPGNILTVFHYVMVYKGTSEVCVLFFKLSDTKMAVNSNNLKSFFKKPLTMILTRAILLYRN